MTNLRTNNQPVNVLRNGLDPILEIVDCMRIVGSHEVDE